MFNWVCPTCGREWDIATTECPDCRGKPLPAAPARRSRSGGLFWVLLAAGTAIGILGLIFWVRYQSRRIAPAPAAATASAESPAPKTVSPPEPVPDSAPAQQIEVAGIRTFYDSQNKPQVRALIVNHGEAALDNVTLTVTLRPMQSAPDSLPLARFTVKIVLPVKPGEWQEVKAPLDTYATLAAMPKWRELRADVEAH